MNVLRSDIFSMKFYFRGANNDDGEDEYEINFNTRFDFCYTH